MIYIDADNKFMETFDPLTGMYIRTGVLERNEATGKCKDSGKDPFMRNYPGLIDVGIMGTCQNAQMGLCKAGGIDCYQSGGEMHQPNMPIDDFENICKQSNGKVFQIALGGRGDPNHHESFNKILETARNHNIVPNYTTSGINLTDDQVAVTKHFCGAVAVSWQRGEHTIQAINKFIAAGCKTNIHFVLGSHTIDEAIAMLQGNVEVPKGVNAVIFLLYKNVGKLANSYRVLNVDRHEALIRTFAEAIYKYEHKFKIGFDSCTVPMLVNYAREHINMDSVDTCEGARFSMYITPDMKALPCSFDQNKMWAVDLRTNTIQQAWNSTQFGSFRDRFRFSCEDCGDKAMCLGGCPIKRDIVLCNRKERRCR